MKDVSHPPPSARSAAAPATRFWMTPRSGARVSVLGVALVMLALPLPWFPPQRHGCEVVLSLTLGGRSGGGWIGVGTVIAALISNVSALRQPGLPRPTWGNTAFLLVTLYLMGVLPGFWEAAGAGPALAIAPGYWVALAGLLVILLGSLVRTSTVLRAPLQAPSTRPRSLAVETMGTGQQSQRGGGRHETAPRDVQNAGRSEERSPLSTVSRVGDENA